MITPSEIRRRLKEIRECTFAGTDVLDDEKAHALEDQLYVDVLKAIVNYSLPGPLAKQLARLALNARRYKFRRWAA